MFCCHIHCLIYLIFNLSAAGMLTGFRLTSDLQSASDSTTARRTSVSTSKSKKQTSDTSNYDGNDDDAELVGERAENERAACSDVDSESADSDSETIQSGRSDLIAAEKLLNSDHSSSEEQSDSGSESDQTLYSSGVDSDENRYASKQLIAKKTSSSSSYKVRPYEREEEDAFSSKRSKKKRERAPTVGSANSVKALKAAKKSFKQKEIDKNSVKKSSREHKKSSSNKSKRASDKSTDNSGSSGRSKSRS